MKAVPEIFQWSHRGRPWQLFPEMAACSSWSENGSGFEDSDLNWFPFPPLYLSLLLSFSSFSLPTHFSAPAKSKLFLHLCSRYWQLFLQEFLHFFPLFSLYFFILFLFFLCPRLFPLVFTFLSPLILPLVYSHVLVTCTLLSNLASPLEFLSSCSPSIQLHSAYLPYPVYSMHFFLSNYHPPLPSSPESASLKAADDFPLARFNSSSSGVLRVKRMHFKSLLGVSHGVW